MSDPKFYCRAEDLAIGYGKTPLMEPVSYTHLRAHETDSYLVCRLLLEKKKMLEKKKKKKLEKKKKNRTEKK